MIEAKIGAGTKMSLLSGADCRIPWWFFSLALSLYRSLSLAQNATVTLTFPLDK